MKVNYVLMYGTPYLKYREFETFEDVSKFLVNKCIVNYNIFKKLEDKEEVEMIYRDNDIRYLEQENYKLREENTHLGMLNCDLEMYLKQHKSKIDKAIEYIKELLSDTKGVLKDYMYHKEHNKILIELLKEDVVNKTRNDK